MGEISSGEGVAGPGHLAIDRDRWCAGRFGYAVHEHAGAPGAIRDHQLGERGDVDGCGEKPVLGHVDEHGRGAVQPGHGPGDQLVSAREEEVDAEAVSTSREGIEECGDIKRTAAAQVVCVIPVCLDVPESVFGPPRGHAVFGDDGDQPTRSVVLQGERSGLPGLYVERRPLQTLRVHRPGQMRQVVPDDGDRNRGHARPSGCQRHQESRPAELLMSGTVRIPGPVAGDVADDRETVGSAHPSGAERACEQSTVSPHSGRRGHSRGEGPFR